MITKLFYRLQLKQAVGERNVAGEFAAMSLILHKSCQRHVLLNVCTSVKNSLFRFPYGLGLVVSFCSYLLFKYVMGNRHEKYFEKFRHETRKQSL